MAITFTNAVQLSTPSSPVPWGGQSLASMSFFFRYETTGSVTATTLNGPVIMNRGAWQYIWGTSPTGNSNTMTLVVGIRGTGGGYLTFNATLNVGTPYHIAVTVAANGTGQIWVNGMPSALWQGPLVGGPYNQNVPIQWGVTSCNPGLIYSVSKFALVNGYAFTATDVANLRDGSKTVAQVVSGTSATWYGYWTLDGTPGTTPAYGDSALANGSGDTTTNITVINTAGGGSAVYTAPLTYAPSVNATPYVCTSGAAIGITFASAGNGAATCPTSPLLSTPTISINGGSPITLINPWVTGSHTAILYAIPPGAIVHPTDSVTISAASAWASTPLGLVGPMSGTIDNRTGRSSVGTDKLPRTLKPGWNHPHKAVDPLCTYSMTKNWVYRCGDFQYALTWDANHRPTSGYFNSISGYFYYMPPYSTMDNTEWSVAGYWAVRWDDTGNHATNPTTLSITSPSTELVSITLMPAYCNPGTPGPGGSQLGIVNVYQITMLSTVITHNNPALYLALTFTSPNKTYSSANEVIFGPGDFTPTTPTVINVPNPPYALSNGYLAWIGTSAGSMRFCDSLWSFGNMSRMYQPEQRVKLSDWSWGFGAGMNASDVVSWAGGTASPWNPTTTPYIYCSQFAPPFGQAYNATLSVAIPDATTTVITISDAATAPVITGLMLLIDSELVRVMSVSGAQVTVSRGELGTTATSHAPQTIQVRYRYTPPNPIPAGYVFTLTTSGAPHNLSEAILRPMGGTWPTLTYTDAVTANGQGTFMLLPTGATTVLAVYPAMAKTPAITLSGTTTITSGCTTGGTFPDGAGLPVEFASYVAGHYPDCNLHLNLPEFGSNAFMYDIGLMVKQYFPAGRKVYVELGDEPWNWAFTFDWVTQPLSLWFYPSQPLGGGIEWYLLRLSQAVTLIRTAFDAGGANRSSEVVCMTNMVDGYDPTAQLRFADNLGVPIDFVAQAAYTGPSNAAATQTAYWQYTDEQAIDLYVHDMYYNTNASHLLQFGTIVNPRAGSVNAALAAYNATYGRNVKMYAYEGGVGSGAPPLTTTLAASALATDTTLALASVAGLIVGIPMCFMLTSQQIAPTINPMSPTEWVVITAINASATPPTITVNRAQFGTTASAYASGASIRTAYLERSHDLIYNPNWYIAEQDLFGLLQLCGFAQFNMYAISLNNSDPGSWYGAYHSPWQRPGYGDGSDGKADNRLTLATPGKTHSKSATTCQDDQCVSVRGQAFLDWMKATQPAKKHKVAFLPYSRRS